jgi:hypothetical protein
MDKDILLKKVVDTSIKMVVRKFPIVLSGEFIGTFYPTHSYMVTNSSGVETNYVLTNNNTVLGVRILFTISKDYILDNFEPLSKRSMIVDGRNDYVYKYLSTLVPSQTETPEEYNELSETQRQIEYLLYKTKKLMDTNNMLGPVEFHIRFYISEQLEPYDFPFYDSDSTIPPREFRI